MKTTTMLKILKLCFCGLFYLAMNDAFATEDITKLNDMVVTAQRKSENVQSVPMSINAVSAFDMGNHHITSANDLNQEIPGLQITNPHGNSQPIFSLRGISASDYTSNQSSPIGVYLDETYLGASTTHGLSFFDLERVEVLKGPQGTLYGKNTTGGAINLISRTPDLYADLETKARIGYGNFQDRELTASSETALLPGRLAIRAAVDYKNDDGWFKNPLGPNMSQTNRGAGRITLNSKLSERLDAVFKLLIARSDARTTTPRTVGAVPIPGLGMSNLVGYVRPTSLGFREGEINYVGHNQVDFNHASLRLSYDANKLKFISVSSWYDTEFHDNQDSDGSPLSLLEINWGHKGKAFSEDLRMESNWGGPFSMIGGVYFGYEKAAMSNTYRFFKDSPVIVAAVDPGTANLLSQFGIIDHRMTTETISTSLYGQGRYQFTERFGMDLGARFTTDQNRLKYLNISHLDQAGNPLGSWLPGNNSGIEAPFLPPAFGGVYLDGAYTQASTSPRSELNKNVSGKINLDYTLSKNIMAYTGYSRGYRNGSFNSGLFYSATSLAQTGYTKPETINAYELGIKSDWLDERLRLNLAGYYYDYQNQQIVNVVGASSQLLNAGGSQIYGLESALIARPIERLRLSLGTNLMHSEYKKLSLANTQTTTIPDDMLNLAGNQLIAAPNFQLTGAIEYSIQPFRGGMVDLGVSGSYQSRQWFSAYNSSPGYENIGQAPYGLMKTYLTISDATDHVSLNFHVDNLLDEDYNAYAINVASGFGYNFFQPGPPRRFGLDLNIRF